MGRVNREDHSSNVMMLSIPCRPEKRILSSPVHGSVSFGIGLVDNHLHGGKARLSTLQVGR